MELNPETVCGLILQVRQFDGKSQEPITEGSNPSDTDAGDVPYKETLEETPADSIESVIRSEIGAMNHEEQRELVALFWIGRGDFEGEEFEAVKKQAAEREDGSTIDYLLNEPLLGDHLANGLAAIGQPCEF